MKFEAEGLEDEEEFGRLVDLHFHDPDTHPMPESKTRYNYHNIVDDLILGYRVEPIPQTDQFRIVVFTDYLSTGDLYIKFDKEKIKELDNLIKIKNESKA